MVNRWATAALPMPGSFALVACVIGAWFFRTQASPATPDPHAADAAIQPRAQGLERH